MPFARSSRSPGARRSWLDAWFPSVAKSLSLGVTTSPVYYDAQAIVERDLGASSTLRATFLGSSDKLAINVPNSSGSDPAFAGDLTNATTFWRAMLRADGKIDKARWMATASIGHDTFQIALGKLHGSDAVTRGQVRAEVDAPIVRGLRARAGIDADVGLFDF